MIGRTFPSKTILVYADGMTETLDRPILTRLFHKKEPTGAGTLVRVFQMDAAKREGPFAGPVLCVGFERELTYEEKAK